MRCAHFRTALSARLDGEPTGLPDRRLDKHLARCATCRAWLEQAERLRGRVAEAGAAGPSADWSANLLASLGGYGSGADRAGADWAGARGAAADGLGATGGPGQGEGGSAPER
ncbi:zf-HC2 domain-containing protein [Kitasatospora sp. NPDC091207]|uniref:zf-HC2 domain-containing protein n=1 Tax=Kitasatospora sp. NPDC091207 TaxID=3364083 RepID=UPI0037FAC071